MLRVIKKTEDWGYGPEYTFSKEGDLIKARSGDENRLIEAGLAVRYLGDEPVTELATVGSSAVVLLGPDVASEVPQCSIF